MNRQPTQADPLSVFEKLLQVNIDQAAVSVCLASVAENEEIPSFELLQLSDDLVEEFRRVAKKLMAKCRKDLAQTDLVIRKYTASSKPDQHEIEYVDLLEHGSIQEQIASLSSPAAFEIFSLSEDFLAGLRFYVIVIQPQNGTPVYCFRIYSPKKELKRSKLFAALLSKGHFNGIEEPVFLFDDFIDCVAVGTGMFIFKKGNFQKIFRFFELVLQTARTTLQTIKGRIAIANFEQLEKACESHIQMLSKLKNIAGKSYLSRITMNDIKKVLAEFPELKVQIVGDAGKEMLVFDPSDKWAILRLLDDDYLVSLMTGENYEVTGKRIYGET